MKAVRTYEFTANGETHKLVTGELEMACLHLSNEFGIPFQPEDFRELPYDPVNYMCLVGAL
jgi:hypothetical protein